MKGDAKKRLNVEPDEWARRILAIADEGREPDHGGGEPTQTGGGDATETEGQGRPHGSADVAVASGGPRVNPTAVGSSDEAGTSGAEASAAPTREPDSGLSFSELIYEAAYWAGIRLRGSPNVSRVADLDLSAEYAKRAIALRAPTREGAGAGTEEAHAIQIAADALSGLAGKRTDAVAIRQRELARIARDAAARLRATPSPEGPICSDCGEPHWYNVWVSDEVWSQIAPGPFNGADRQGGILCVRCIDARCERAGIKAEGRFLYVGSGLRVPPGPPSPEVVEALSEIYDEIIEVIQLPSGEAYSCKLCGESAYDFDYVSHRAGCSASDARRALSQLGGTER